jgi:acetate---CoA ligase (ADP-forming)
VSCPMPDRVSQPFRDAGLALYLTETEAVGALGSLLGQQERLRAARSRLDGAMPVSWRQQSGAGQKLLDEAASMKFLAQAGLPMVEHRLCSSGDEAVEAFFSMGARPVVVKGCSAKVIHKSDLDLVRLNVTGESEVRSAYAEVESDRGAIVARFERGRRELLLGLHHDRNFGPVVMVGDGGTYVETTSDVQVLLPPFEAADVLRALDRLRVAPVLRGSRGQPPVDLWSVAEAAVSLGALAAEVVSVDVNPLIVSEHGCVAADAVVILPS